MRFYTLTLVAAIFLLSIICPAQIPEIQPLWPNGIPGNPVKYKAEKLVSNTFRESSLSRSNRVFSCVSEPGYVIYRPDKGKADGAAMVICPGGGFRDVWFDREGSDLAIFLAQHGVTCLVLKYRTFNTDQEGFKLEWKDYAPHVYADARQAIYILRSRAKELGIDEKKIGIGGFSAGGSLSMMTALDMYQKSLPTYAKFGATGTAPDFVGLFYPGLNPGYPDMLKNAVNFPPVFIMNGGEDTTTPASGCIELYNALASKKFSVELHIYSKGAHGFDSGIERGFGAATWRDSFVAWLKDRGFVSEK